MKKYISIALAYATAAMGAGVFYREFTKWNGFAGVTALGKVHAHLFLLGMMVFLLVALFAQRLELSRQRGFRIFMTLYNIGVPLTALMMTVRGVTQVLAFTLPVGADAAISGLAGCGHILAGTGLVMLLLTLRKAADAAGTAA